MEFSLSKLGETHEKQESEWLETNGLGGFASSTISFTNRRKYHGLLVSNIRALNNRFVLLSKVDDSIYVDGKKIGLSLHSFSQDDIPSSLFSSKKDSVELEKSVVMVNGEDTVLVTYRLVSAKKVVTLKVNPLFAYRMYHLLSKQNFDLNYEIREQGHSKKNYKVVAPYRNMPELFMGSDSEYEFNRETKWVHNVEYSEELSRGYEGHEDLFSYGTFDFKMKKGDQVRLYFSLTPNSTKLDTIYSTEIKRRASIKKSFGYGDDPISLLKTNGEKFFVKNVRVGSSIIAGYPWFSEWGRDSMVAVVGLALYSNRIDEAKEILISYSKLLDSGLLPNCLPTGLTDYPIYHSVDASLLFFYAVQEYLKVTSNFKDVVKHFKNPMYRVLKDYVRGIVPIAEITPEGLIWSGTGVTNYTWMDASISGRAVTPRHGYAVEINALWYNALKFYKYVCERANDKSDLPLDELIAKCKTSFKKKFWSDEYKFLADTVNEYGSDYSLRPNQIFAVSLPYSMLSQWEKMHVFKVVKDELLTPYGLRTLSKKDPRYIGKYAGNVVARDHAYHQGTVWPWLLAHFVKSALKVVKDKKSAAKYLKNYFKPLVTTHLKNHGLFSVSEIMNGDKDHKPNGCPFQAWSVGEVIRCFAILDREILLKKGKK